MGKKPDIYRLKRTLLQLKKKNRKYVTIETLSKWVGVYSDVLADDLVYFEPLIRMDPSINLNDLVPAIEAFLADEAKGKEEEEPIEEVKPKRQIAKKKELLEYSSIGDFVYKVMAGAGGLVSPSSSLSDHDLHVLAKLVKDEQTRRKEKAKPKKKKKK